MAGGFIFGLFHSLGFAGAQAEIAMQQHEMRDRMNNIYKIVSLIIVIFPTIVYSSDSPLSRALTIDPSVPSFKEYSFNQEDDIEPRVSEFSIVNQIFMSNEEGERWATMTLKNLSTGQRIFSNDQLVAVFANGEKRYPGKIELKLHGAEAATHTFYFGRNKFPILYVYVKNKN